MTSLFHYKKMSFIFIKIGVIYIRKGDYMEKEEIIELIDEDIVDKAVFYDHQHLPAQISNAMYLYGNNKDFEIIAFIDASAQSDGSLGMIMTAQGAYFCFKEPQSFRFGDIEQLSLVWQKEHHSFYARIQTTGKTYVFKNSFLNLENFVKVLAQITEKKIDFVMDPYEKVVYFVPLVLADMEDDVYEDLDLGAEEHQQINDIYHELEMIGKLPESDQQDELRALCRYVLDFFERFGLESEEIDALMQAQDFFDQKSAQEDQQLEGAKKWFDEMSESYRQGNTEMYDQLKSAMNSLGIDEEALKNMSPQEVDEYVRQMCKKFGISQSLFEKMKDRFGR